MFGFSPGKIFVSTKPCDMRKSFDGLLALINRDFNDDAYSGNLYLFCSRRGDLIKAIWWDRDGWAIFAKRLELGRFCFPEVKFIDGKYQPVQIERADLLLLLEGIDTGSAKRLKRYQRPVRDHGGSGTPKVSPGLAVR